MRARHWLPLVFLLVAAPAFAAEPPCPLDLVTCLSQYQRMKERPWLGVDIDRDSTGAVVVVGVKPGSPAQRAGIRNGDVLRTIEGVPPAQWFAGKAGWKDGDEGPVAVMRDGHERNLHLRYHAIPEDVFARMIGVHMIEGHLAYMHVPGRESQQH